MDDPEVWRWIWLMLTVFFFIGEMLAPGTFFLAPFGAGAAVALLLSLAGVNPVISLLAFIVVSGGAFAALRPLARKLDREGQIDGIGAKRLIGEDGAVLEAIPGGTDLGLVRVGREQWRAGNPSDRVADQPPRRHPSASSLRLQCSGLSTPARSQFPITDSDTKCACAFKRTGALRRRTKGATL